MDWDAARKDGEQGFGDLKLNFQIHSNPIDLHRQDGRCYIVMTAILMNDMMVETWIEKDEMEDGAMYNIVNAGVVETEHEPGGNGYDNDSIPLVECLIDGEGDSVAWDKSAK